MRWEREGKLHPRTRKNERTPPVRVYDPQEIARIPIRNRRSAPKTAGEVEARIFEMLSAGASLIDIVIGTEQTLDHVERARDRWLELGGERMAITAKQHAMLADLVGDFEDTAELIANVQTAIAGKP